MIYSRHSITSVIPKTSTHQFRIGETNQMRLTIVAWILIKRAMGKSRDPQTAQQSLKAVIESIFFIKF